MSLWVQESEMRLTLLPQKQPHEETLAMHDETGA